MFDEMILKINKMSVYVMVGCWIGLNAFQRVVIVHLIRRFLFQTLRPFIPDKKKDSHRDWRLKG